MSTPAHTPTPRTDALRKPINYVMAEDLMHSIQGWLDTFTRFHETDLFQIIEKYPHTKSTPPPSSPPVVVTISRPIHRQATGP